MNGLALCAGSGNLELGLAAAMRAHGINLRSVCYVERDLDAVVELRERIEDGSLDEAPIWDDVVTFDAAPWRGKVDIVSAGYPCQGESLAGRRAGEDDPRWLWPHIWRIVRLVGARYLAIENVAAHLSGSFGHVAGDLAASGWRVVWDCVPAAAAGAPIRRDRVFALAASPMVGWFDGSLGDTASHWRGATPLPNTGGRSQVERSSEQPGRMEHNGRDRGSLCHPWDHAQAPEPCLYRVVAGCADVIPAVRKTETCSAR